MHLKKTYSIVLMCLLQAALDIHISQAQSSVPRYLVGLSKTSHSLAIVDPATLKVVDTVRVGPDPHEVVVSPDGRTAYVSNTGSGFFHRIDVIDLVTRKALDTINTSPLIGPHGLSFTGGKLWFAAQGAKAVGRFDPQTRTMDLCLGTGQERTHMLYVTRDTRTVLATSVGSGTISLFNYVQLPPIITPMGYALPTAKPYQDWVQTIVPFKPGNEGYAVSPDEKEFWTATPVDGSIAVIDIAGKKVTDTINAGITGANRLAFSADGSMVLISSLRTGDLYFYDAKTRREIKHINIGHGCAHILVDATQARAFVSCTPDNYIAVIDLKKLVMTGRIEIGGRPDGLSWTQP